MTFGILFFLTAIGFGAGDFFAGTASRKDDPISVCLLSQIVASAIVAAIALLLVDLPGIGILLPSAGAGLAIGCAYLFYYRALRGGLMGLMAATVGVVGALVPLGLALVAGERPSGQHWAGLAVVLAGIFLLGQHHKKRMPAGDAARGAPRAGVSSETAGKAFLDSAAAGLLFGLGFFFVGLSSNSTGNPFWPAAIAFAVSLVPIAAVASRHRFPRPRSRSFWPWVLLAGIGQGIGFAAFGMAVVEGLIAIAAVAGAISPVPTLLMARCFLHETLTKVQTGAVGLALVGSIILVTG